MEFKVFDCSMVRSQMDLFSVVMSLARVIHSHSIVGDVLSDSICETYNSVVSFEWTSNS